MPSLLLLIPHPDDESYAFAGLAIRAARAGWRVTVHCASSGEHGKRHDGGRAGAEHLGPAREAELEDSCRVLGVEPPHFWRLPDGALRNHESALIESGDRAIRSLQPDLVATLGADGAYGHPDHIALHRATETVFGSAAERSALVFRVFPPALFLPQYQKCLAMMGDPPDPPPSAIGSDRWHFALDVSSLRDEKLAAIAAHRTQLPGGDPRAIFPPGIVDALLTTERYAFSGPEPAGLRQLLVPLGAEFAPLSH